MTRSDVDAGITLRNHEVRRLEDSVVSLNITVLNRGMRTIRRGGRIDEIANIARRNSDGLQLRDIGHMITARILRTC